MGPDFSALDAELDSLETGPSRSDSDILALARAYVSNSVGVSADGSLQHVDLGLNEIDADSKLLRSRSSFPPEQARPASRRPEARLDANEEIVLPEPIPRESFRSEPGSGEMPLHAQPQRSGAYSLEQQQRAFSRDDTLEPFDDELMDAADHDLVEFTAAEPASSDGTGEKRRPSIFSRPPPSGMTAQEEADLAFEELFSDPVTRQSSSIPSSEHGSQPETYSDDTETFDTSSLAFIEKAAKSPDAALDEDLDSAEFEIMVDDAKSKPAGRSEPPEKRPSFLGRLFGRKDE